ncbi:energy-coupling factor ABC transporter substrate-binding protein [Aneurinibacillus aneurinilyticus]|jgi:cobalt/nickel transport protein|uniref:Cobalt transport protein CbiN n=1 Tax=Aneurinibacillus aneurinilyticus TaxID=1391 RepID=A0A848CUR8_ANEAE|nr:energy-coupling factor ABC transporter substrate-binding protein [Aneurinibacillus aneurinilyticus]MCI1694135.1 energy-coupling factor ABC transporter substrate-binding protein [Aneurinibacillus aneurinilyticus]MED0672441.1 energy-coupling factor ABC transporter substrate-binding protein [Aneurinibacillus aneurinilyticus]NME99513.1 energy-coupling factor ABC transporter substrate-binding protein [Aneurinibacillus aneurinilyticus]
MNKPKGWLNVLIVLAVVALIVFPLIIVKDSEFGGADGAAEEAITEVAPGYEPWFQPLMEPPGGETESLLFALQAALGAGVIGYAIGYYKARSTKRERSDEHSA